MAELPIGELIQSIRFSNSAIFFELKFKA